MAKLFEVSFKEQDEEPLDLKPLFFLPQEKTRELIITVAKQYYRDGKLPVEVLSALVLASSPVVCVTTLFDYLITQKVPVRKPR